MKKKNNTLFYYIILKNMEKEFFESWAKFRENKNDYKLGSIWDRTLSECLANTKADNITHQYNQAQLHTSQPYEDTRWSCALFGNFGAVSDLTWYEFTKSDILEIQKSAVDNYWLEMHKWMYLDKARDCVRNWWNNKNPNKRLITFTINLRDNSEKNIKILNELYKKNKTLVIWYHTTKEHYVDSQDNGVLDLDAFLSAGYEDNWWHCVRYNKARNIDNYYEYKKYNIYENNKLVALSNEWTYFKYAYVYFFAEDFEKIFTDVYEWAPFYDAIKWAKDKWLVNWYDDGSFRPNDKISRWEFVWILKKYDEINNKK